MGQTRDASGRVSFTTSTPANPRSRRHLQACTQITTPPTVNPSILLCRPVVSFATAPSLEVPPSHSLTLTCRQRSVRLFSEGSGSPRVGRDSALALRNCTATALSAAEQQGSQQADANSTASVQGVSQFAQDGCVGSWMLGDLPGSVLAVTDGDMQHAREVRCVAGFRQQADACSRSCSLVHGTAWQTSAHKCKSSQLTSRAYVPLASNTVCLQLAETAVRCARKCAAPPPPHDT